MEAAELGDAHLYALRLEFEAMPPTYRSVEDLAAAAGVAPDDVIDLWSRLGFRDASMNNPRFTDDDAHLVRVFRDVQGVNPTAPAAMLDMLRLEGAMLRQIAAGAIDTIQLMLPGGISPARAIRSEMQPEEMLLTSILINDVDRFLGAMMRRHFIEQFAGVTDEDARVLPDGAVDGAATVVFVDIVDFTALTSRIDARELVDMLSAFEDYAHATARAHHGRVVKTLGDGAMLSFHDETHAVQAAFDLVCPSPELPPRRVGLATGRAVLRQGDLFGPVVNLAARLAAIAPMNGVVSDRCPEGFRAEVLAPVALKGFDTPVTPYRVVR